MNIIASHFTLISFAGYKRFLFNKSKGIYKPTGKYETLSIDGFHVTSRLIRRHIGVPLSIA